MNKTTAILGSALALSLGVIGFDAASGLGAGEGPKNAADVSSAAPGRHVVIDAVADRRAPARITTYVVPPTDDATSFGVRLPRVAPGTYNVHLTAILADASASTVCYFDTGQSYTALSYGTYISGYSVGHSTGFFRATAGHHYSIQCHADSGNIAFSSAGDTSSVTLTKITRKVVHLQPPTV